MEKKIYMILEELRPECNFCGSENYIEDGLLESYDLIMLIAELENKYHIVIEAEDVIPENFSSAAGIAALVQKCGGII